MSVDQELIAIWGYRSLMGWFKTEHSARNTVPELRWNYGDRNYGNYGDSLQFPQFAARPTSGLAARRFFNIFLSYRPAIVPASADGIRAGLRVTKVMKFTTPCFGRRRANFARIVSAVSVKIDEDSARGGLSCAPSTSSTSPSWSFALGCAGRAFC